MGSVIDAGLRDAAEIQEEDIGYKRKRHEREGRRGKYPYEPLFTVADVDRTLPLMVKGLASSASAAGSGDPTAGAGCACR